MTLYQFAKLPIETQAGMRKLLQAEIAACELANAPTLVKKYYLAAMEHVMTGRTRNHVSRNQPADPAQCASVCVTDSGAVDRSDGEVLT